MPVLDMLRISILRSLYVSLRFKSQIIIYRGTRFSLERGARISVAPGGRLVVGRHTSGTPSTVKICRNGSLVIGGRVSVSRGTRIWIGGGATVEIGDGTFIHLDTAIMCWERVTIGTGCLISWNVNMIDGNQHQLVMGGISWPKTSPIEIGDHVWIGTNVTIIGTSIGDGSVIGAGSVVTSAVPAKVVVNGNPAKVVVEDVSWAY